MEPSQVRPESAFDPEAPSGFFKELVGWFATYTKLKKYLATRKAVIAGERLVDMSAEQLKQLDLMGPLTFNAYETTLASVPSLLLNSVFSTLFPLAPRAVPHIEGQTAFQHAFLAEIIAMSPIVSNTFLAFVPPLVLLLSAIVMGWASLESFDSNKKSRRRSRNAFLYFDGVYGLLPQTLAATSFALVHLGATPVFRADGNYELGDLLPSVLKRMRDLCGKAADAAQSWGKTIEREVATTRKNVLSSSNAAVNVEQWAVNKAVHYNAWANFGKKDFEPVVTAFKELLNCFVCQSCESWLYVTPRGTPDSLRCACNAISLNLKSKDK